MPKSVQVSLETEVVVILPDGMDPFSSEGKQFIKNRFQYQLCKIMEDGDHQLTYHEGDVEPITPEELVHCQGCDHISKSEDFLPPGSDRFLCPKCKSTEVYL